jgi:WD40 repeat protein
MIADLDQVEGSNQTELEKNGEHFEFNAPVTEAVSIGDTIIVGFGDGKIRFFKPNQKPHKIQAHSGVILCMVRTEDYILTGGDDGRFLQISMDGEIEEIANFGSRWVDSVAAYKGDKVCSSDNVVYIWSKENEKKSFKHQSTISGLTFSPNGKHLAVSRYGGVTVWERKKNKWSSSNYSWKGSHGKVTFSPDGKYLVTSMQENQLHGWRLSDKADLAMSGYPAKIKSFNWVGETPYLVTSGASEAVCWPFDGKEGPMGRKPICVASGGKQYATFIESLTEENAIFVGYRDGLVLLSEIDEKKNSITVRNPTGSEVSAIVVSESREDILIGDIKGNVTWSSIKPKKTEEKNV